MGVMLDTVFQFLQEDGWDPRQVGTEPIYSGQVDSDFESWLYFAQVEEEESLFIFYSVPEFDVPVNKMLAVAEFLTRVNFNLPVGSLDMDFSDGQVRFRTGVDVEGGQLTPAMVKNLVYTNVLLMSRYLPGIKQVAFEEIEPVNAISQIQEDDSEQ